MGVLARLKSIGGGKRTVTITPSSTTYVPDNSNYLEMSVSGSATITSLVAGAFTRTRLVRFYCASGSVMFVHTAVPAVNQMFLNGGSRVLLAGDMISLILKSDGSWTLDSVNN